MKFLINRNDFVKGLNIVSKGISTQITEPILTGIYIEAINDIIVLRSSNGVRSIQYEMKTRRTDEVGACVIPGKQLINLVKSYPNEIITISTKDNHIEVACGNSKPLFNTIDSNLYPSFPHVDIEKQIEIPFKLFSHLTKQITSTVSKDESRPILTGILISIEENVLNLISTDSYRIASTSITLKDNIDNFEMVIPGAFLNDIVSLPLEDEKIIISYSENQILIECNNTTFITRRIEGNFPPCKKIEPKSYIMRLELSKEAFIEELKKNAIFSQLDGAMILSGDPEVGFVNFKSLEGSIGTFNGGIECRGEGVKTQIAFRCSYLLDGLNAIPSDTLYFEVEEGNKTGIFRSINTEENMWYLIIPVHV